MRIGKEFIDKLSAAHEPVLRKSDKFFFYVDKHNQKGADDNALELALKELLDCSPKRVIAAFQERSLEAGVAFVRNHNRLIDEFAMRYPRCRGGIYASRLNYSDVIQVSEEVIATLRATSTVLDDVERRYDMLEALTAQLSSDLASKEIHAIWNAAKASFKNSAQGIAYEDAAWYKKAFGVGVGAVSWAQAVLSVPQALFQGQLARVHRIKVFIATSLLLRHGWAEWSRMNERIVIPNLKVMFALKCDFVANRVFSITDLISTNGYALEGLVESFGSAIAEKT